MGILLVLNKKVHLPKEQINAQKCRNHNKQTSDTFFQYKLQKSTIPTLLKPMLFSPVKM